VAPTKAVATLAPAVEPELAQDARTDVIPVASIPGKPNWRNCPIVVLDMVTDAWLGWKGFKRVVPVREVANIDDMDYEMTMTSGIPPVVTVTMRCNQNARISRNVAMNVCQAKIDKIVAQIGVTQQPLDENAKLQESLLAAKETRSDPEWIKQQEDSLIGWDKRADELNAMLADLNADLEVQKCELNRLGQLEFVAKQQWEFKLDELE
jgi:hypothetical protein